MSQKVFEGDYCLAAGVETTYRTDAMPTTTANAMQVACNIEPFKINSEMMNYDAGNAGARSSQKTGVESTGSLDGYLAGSGTATTPPIILVLAKGAGLKVTIEADHVAVVPQDLHALDSLTLKFFRGKHRHDIVGWRSDWEINLEVEKLPTFKFPSGRGVPVKIEKEDAFQVTDFSGFKQPLPVELTTFVKQQVFGHDLLIKSVNLKGGNKINWNAAAGETQIAGREVLLDIVAMEPDLAVIDLFAEVMTFGAIALQLGQDVVDEGHIWEFGADNAQLLSATPAKDGTIKLSYKCIPTGLNNDFWMKFR